MSDHRTNSGTAADLLVELRRDGAEPLHRQLEAAIRSRIRDEWLRAGTSLPSTRRLGVSRGVVVEAYQQLAAQGYLASRSGGYTQVAQDLAVDAALTPAPAPRPPPDHPRIDFKYCQPDVTQFPRTAWLRSLRRAVYQAPDEQLAYPSSPDEQLAYPSSPDEQLAYPSSPDEDPAPVGCLGDAHKRNRQLEQLAVQIRR